MTLRSLLSTLALGATLVVSAAAQADSGATGASAATNANACFAGHRLGPVRAHHRTEQQSYGFQELLAGAHVFVYAEPGLTAEWLHYSLEQQRATAVPSSSCPLDVPGSRLTVQSGGPGFWVTLSSESTGTAREILKRAERINPR
jgi:hypothetical protein